MADITTLGMAVDSSGVRRASDDLDQMSRAGRDSEKAISELEGAMTSATIKGNIIGEAIGEFAIKAFDAAKGFLSLGIEIGRYQDIAEKTGSNDPAGLASLRTSADVAGTSVEGVALAINRMALTLGRSEDSSRGAGKALASIGIEINEFKKLDGPSQYKALADALDRYQDSQRKVQVVQAITGRGGAEQLVMLKELAGETEKQTFLTNDQIRAADALGDSMARSRSEISQAAEVLSAEAAPAIAAVVGVSGDLIKEMLGIRNGAKDLAKDTGFADFADGVASALGIAADSIDLVIRGYKALQLTREVNAKVGPLLMQLEFGQIRDMSKKFNQDMEDIFMAPQPSARLAQRMKELKDAAKAASEIDKKPEIKYDGPGNTGGKPKVETLREERDEYKLLMDTLTSKIAVERQEEELGRKLTESEKERIDITDKLNRFKKAINEDQMEAIDLTLEELAAIRARNKELDSWNKLMKDDAEETANTIESAVNRTKRLQEEAATAEDALLNYGKSEAALRSLSSEKLRDAAATLRQRTAMNDGEGAYAALNAEINAQADALERVADAQDNLANKKAFDRADALGGAERALKIYSESVKDVGEETQASVNRSVSMLEDGLTSFAATGKADMHSLIDYMISETLRLAIIRPFLADVFGSGSSGSGGFIGAILGLLSGGGSGGYSFNGGVGTTNAAGISGGRAFGGDVDPFSIQPVAERGPELATLGGKTYLMTGSKGGTVTSSDRSGLGSKSITLISNPTIQIDARSDQGQILSMTNAALEKNNKALLEMLQAQGKV